MIRLQTYSQKCFHDSNSRRTNISLACSMYIRFSHFKPLQSDSPPLSVIFYIACLICNMSHFSASSRDPKDSNLLPLDRLSRGLVSAYDRYISSTRYNIIPFWLFHSKSLHALTQHVPAITVFFDIALIKSCLGDATNFPAN